ncbi:hypothetical protein ES706_02412 [subsurface metagenome]
MRRIKSIDAFRGLCIFYMIIGHAVIWWTKESHKEIVLILRRLTEILGATGFLFVSGISVVLALRKKMEKVKADLKYSMNDLFKEHYARSLLFLVLALMYNAITLIWFMGLSGIWSWYILFTITICLLIAYPLIKLQKITRISLAFFIIFFTYPLFGGLENLIARDPESGWTILYYILFNPIQEYPILPYFAFFSIGTVVGEIFYEIYSIKQDDLKDILVKKKIVRNFIIYGGLLITTAVLCSIFIFDDPISFIIRTSFTWMLYGIGLDLILIGFLTYLHEFILTPEWRYRFLFYFSYYSLTLYLGHNVIAFIFWERLDIVTCIAIAILVAIGFWYLTRFLYNKSGPKYSVKYLISKRVS